MLGFPGRFGWIPSGYAAPPAHSSQIESCKDEKGLAPEDELEEEEDESTQVSMVDRIILRLSLNGSNV